MTENLPEKPADTPAPTSRLVWLGPVLAGVAIVLTLGLAWQGYDRAQLMEVQLARRINAFDAASEEARAAAKAANAALADLQGRLGALESTGQETLNQQLALNAMYQDLARSQDERVVADIEQTLLLAQQQLQLAGNVKAALIGLDAAATRLAQLDKPQFNGLRDAIARDMERLKLLPAADIVSLNARLEALIQNVDRLKPESDTEPAPVPTPAARGAADTLARFSAEAWREFKSLVRIRRLDHPDLPLLAPSQLYFLRENLKLRLLAARMSLLQRDETAFRNDIGEAHAWTSRYFNPRDEATGAVLASLDEMRKVPVVLKDAEIDASLKAARAARGKNL
ncbi:MAG: uroporphyrinogen-III C-methyltransferase [Gallionellaceae bacterium]|nr:uroporphyrinogen-III C-methyltransferase [Gallionellaceae bacterium]